ncbi:hypothetical protein PENPOL_c002G10469 [Penicillium polonicum]|uniref:Uncharacterized protein n=1 Tax=Penicillium polonicum TaxID=60169 RepID=A0A1V6NX02_PENPO|nr:hypothetical protein PENPOL_c002G10469 [Penicillium polonicum]
MFDDQAQSIESLLVAPNDRTQNSPAFDNALNAIVPRKENPFVLWASLYGPWQIQEHLGHQADQG